MKIFAYLLFILVFTNIVKGQEFRYIDIAGGKIHYKIIGEGKHILIINGGPGFSSEGFLSIAKEIAELGFATILYDQRGTGKSTLTTIDSTTITMDLMVQDIELIRKDLGLSSFILFGHSFGGMLANYYTSKFPNNVSAIIHSSSGGLDLQLIENAQGNLYARLTEQEIDSLNFWRGQLQINNTALNRIKFNQYLASAYVYHKNLIPVVSNRLMQGNLNLNRMVWNDLFSINFDCKPTLRTFDKPVLILQGKQDIIPQSLALTADSVFAKSNLFFIENCGHYGWLDQKETYLNHIKNFLNTL